MKILRAFTTITKTLMRSAFSKTFCVSFQSELDRLAKAVELPSIDHIKMFALFQRKPADKATGLDGWKIKEVQALPPGACQAINPRLKLPGCGQNHSL